MENVDTNLNFDYLNEMKEYALKYHVPIIKDEALEYIIDILIKLKPKKILELGTAIAYSSSYFFKVLLKNNIYPEITTIEKNKEMYDIATKNITKLGLNKYIKVVNYDALDYLKNNLNDNDKFDFIFIDAAKSSYLNYVKEVSNNLDQNGIIIADNVLFRGYVLGNYTQKKYRTIVNNLRKFLDYLKNSKDFSYQIIDKADGLCVIQKKNI